MTSLFFIKINFFSKSLKILINPKLLNSSVYVQCYGHRPLFKLLQVIVLCHWITSTSTPYGENEFQRAAEQHVNWALQAAKAEKQYSHWFFNVLCLRDHFIYFHVGSRTSCVWRGLLNQRKFTAETKLVVLVCCWWSRRPIKAQTYSMNHLAPLIQEFPQARDERNRHE